MRMTSRCTIPHAPVAGPIRTGLFGGLVVCCALAMIATPSRAADGEKEAKRLELQTAVTEHFATIAGATVEYTATAGTMLLKDDAGEPTASIFYVAYTRKGVSDLSRRPITFAFNGGPGSSSVWLHLGLLGPRRVALTPAGSSPSGPPYHLEDNPESLLDISDLVMIDPVSTGYSRAADTQEAKQFHAYQADIRSVGEFIRLYVTDNARWRSPKFLIGESYGGTRAAGLCRYLQDEQSMYLNGAVLISPAINFQTIGFDKGNDLPYVLFLPAYTAAAWYHKKLDDGLQQQGLQEAVAESARFAQGKYLQALVQGDALTDDQRNHIAGQIARFTGLGAEYVRRSNLRIVSWRFAKQLLKDEERTLGRFDSRMSGDDLEPVLGAAEYDPSFSEVSGVFTAAINDYLRSELSFDSDQPYEVLTDRVQPWDYGQFENRYVDASGALRRAMTTNPNLRLMVACGYYDLATPMSGTEYSVNHLQLAPALRKNVTARRYRAGHMMYLKRSCLERLRRDLVKFYAEAMPSEAAAVAPAQTERNPAQDEAETATGATQ